MGDTGLERLQKTLGNRDVGAGGVTESVTVDFERDRTKDTQLMRIIDAWPTLKEDARRPLLAIVEMSRETAKKMK